MKLNNIKDSFDNREINPRPNSWDKLSSRLDEEEKKNKKPIIYWLGAIAAILIAALLIYPSLNKDLKVGGDDEANQIVNTKKNADSNLQKIEFKENVEVVAPVENQALVISESDKELEKKEVIQKTNNQVEEQSIALTTEKEMISTKEEVNPIEILKPDNLQPIKESLIVDKNDKIVVATIDQPVIQKTLTAEEEMELLLNKAMGKVEATEVAVKSINPDKLLMETEWDIESDRRNRVQNSIQNGLRFLKEEAVAIVGLKK